ncbi:hypothetical protein [Aminobacter aminovorans]|uniref:Uncharacterized protein n=1 Tax=Aminobacter aminovorans TaxID=83263 RepID=A0AAC8YPC4_AMIAI|nr:hypothetical protein [Aminobacter aminovorans]AMS41166.1 hypothetical protein AA2016_2237 [Aminobacter aminovorans]MBB3705852.1 hypothetical protein [Aminobacter aminovorans]
MFWAPDLRFAGETVFVIGGGPSLAGFDFSRLAGRRVIAVNSAGYDAPWADILFFHDNSWFEEERNRALVDGWSGLVMTVSRHAKLAAPERVMRVEIAQRPDFPIGQGPIKAGRSSGQTAVSLAVAMGAAAVALLGFDMRDRNGVTHYHADRPLYTAEHAERTVGEYAATFLPAWAGWNAAAAKAGCRILNATPGSALTEFPTVDLETLL